MIPATSPAKQVYPGLMVRKTRLDAIDRVAVAALLGELLGTPIEVLGIEEGPFPDGDCDVLFDTTTEELPLEAMFINVTYRET